MVKPIRLVLNGALLVTLLGICAVAVLAQTKVIPVKPGGTAIPLWVADSPCSIVTTGGGTNTTTCSGSATNMYEMRLLNTLTSIQWLRLYNGTATCNSSTNFVPPAIPIPPASSAGLVGGLTQSFPTGRAFSSGLSACVSGAADGSTNNTAGVYVDIGYGQ